jgi:D-glycero-D-manno-heptose 1,7-bisphosphate phosphatase
MNRCVFLDRDGVINEKPPEGSYVTRWDEFVLIPAVIDWVRLFNALDLLVIIVTNQRGIALGLMSQEALQDIHGRMLALFQERGARIDDIFVCPHQEGTCDCRKPRPGLVREAQSKWNLDLAQSLLIGDSERDRQLAESCRIPFLRAARGKLVT